MAFTQAVAIQDELKRTSAQQQADLVHARQAFMDAVAVQQDLQRRNERLEADLAHARQAFHQLSAAHDKLNSRLLRSGFRRWLPPRLTSGAAALRRVVRGTGHA
jgi:hypothetical protein